MAGCGTHDGAPAVDEPHAADDAPAPAEVVDVAEAAVEAHAAATHPLEAMDAVLAMFPMYIDTGLPHVEGTTFRFAITSDTPWSGLFGGGIFHTSVIEDNIRSLFAGDFAASGSIFSVTPDWQFGQDGIANWSQDLSANTMTIHLQEDVYWHDGVPLTLDDLVFAIEVIAHPDYTGPRRTPPTTQLVGFEEFGAGDADTISGLTLSNDNRTLIMNFTEMSPSMVYAGSLHTVPMPRHAFEGIPVAEMPESDAVLVNPIGWGPFIVQNVVAGEAVHLVRNENFVRGVPLIEEIVIERITTEVAPIAMETGAYDIVEFPVIYFGDHQNPTNFTFSGQLIGDYNYISFRVGHWDFDNNVNVFDTTRTMSNTNLRRAMAYAADEESLANTIFHGLRFPAATNAPAHHRGLHDHTVPGFPFSPQRAMELLDEAGFIDTTGDGFRDDPNGDPLTIIWAFPTQPMEEIIIAHYIQNWASVGLRVELWQGRTHDIFYLWDVLDYDDDDDEIDIYMGAWSPAADPSPVGSWGHIIWNASRYTSAGYDAILDRMGTPAAFDPDYMRQVFSDWQWYWYHNMPYYPTMWRMNLWAANNRVTRWDNRVGIPPQEFGWHLIGLSAPEPYSS